jgi:hypothetical protein
MSKTNEICPVTHGHPTKMTERGFTAACAARRRVLLTDGNWLGAKSDWMLEDDKCRLVACQTCGGKRRPAELTIIALADFNPAKASQQNTEVIDMAKKQAVCDSCGKDKQVETCGGMRLCSTCVSLAGMVVKRPETVVRMLVKRGDPAAFLGLLADELGLEWIGHHLPGSVILKIENETLEPVAKIIGCEGMFGDDLLDAIEARVKTRELLNAENDAMAEQNKELKRGYDERQESIYRLNDVLAEKDRTIASLRDQCTALENRMAIKVIDTMGSASASTLDSHLLDLALDAMRGHITGLDPDRIAMLREVV